MATTENTAVNWYVTTSKASTYTRISRKHRDPRCRYLHRRDQFRSSIVALPPDGELARVLRTCELCGTGECRVLNREVAA